MGEIISVIAATKKMPTSDYKEIGKYPIIDQSHQYICGYSDDEDALINKDNEDVIVFGDHTCTLKHIAFTFVQGADGIKVFQSSNPNCVDTRYLYYFLCASPLISPEYKRHFSDLKEKNITWPISLTEQYQIADCLSSIDNTINTHIDKLEHLANHKRGLMQQLFPQA